MEHGLLGNGDRLPLVGFGTWDVRGRSGVRVLCEALEVGYRLIDTAHMYDNERVVGEALRTSGVPRENVFVTTKLDRPYAGYEKALDGCDHSLRELGLDYDEGKGTLDRSRKDSFYWYKTVIASNGEGLS